MTVMRDGPHESKSLDEGEPRETTARRKEKTQGKRKEIEECCSRETGLCSKESGRRKRKRDRSAPSKC